MRLQFIPLHQFVNIVLVKRCPHSFELSLQSVLALVSDILFFFLQCIFYTTPCLSSNHETQPVFRRLLFIARDDLHLVTASQLMTDRDQLVIHFCTNGLHTNSTVDTKSKIKRC